MTTTEPTLEVPVKADALDALLQELRSQERLTIGPREEIAVRRLLAVVFTDGAVTAAQELKGVLAPVLARSADERQKFARAFDRHFPPPRPPERSVQHAPPEPKREDAKRQFQWSWIILLLVVLGGVAAAAYLMQPNKEAKDTAQTTVAQGSTADVTVGRQGLVEPEQDSAVTPVPTQSIREAVDEVLLAASQWSYAPTLDELCDALAPRYGWAPEGLAIRLHELTGLPRRQVLPLLSDRDIVSRLVLALWLVDDPARVPGGDDVETQSAAALKALESTPIAAYQFARQWPGPSFSTVPRTQLVAAVRLATADPTAGAATKSMDFIRTLLERLRFGEVYESVDEQSLVVEGRVDTSGSGSPLLGIVARADGTPLLQESLALMDPKGSSDGPPREIAERIDAAARRWERARAAKSLSEPAVAQEARASAAFADKTVSDDDLWRALGLWGRLRGVDLRRDAPAQASAAGVFVRAPSATPWLSAALVLLVTGFWLGQVLDRRRAYLRRRAPRTPVAIHELVAEQVRDTHARKLVFAKAARRLQSWAERDTGRIDIGRTIDATLLSGRFTPIAARAKSQPEYLFLIEAATTGDQQAARLRTLVARLEDRVRNVTVYYYATTPTWCHPEDEKRRADAPFARPAQPIEELFARYPAHRLVVLGTGDGFIVENGRLPPPGVRQLAQWRQRAMLTPRALDEWGPTELALAQELSLPIGRATEEGLMSLALLLGLDGREGELFSAEGDAMARPVPPLFRHGRIEWTLDRPPVHAEWPALRAALKSYLDPPAYLWLCACAVYPALRWDLLLFLGVALKQADGTSIYREDRLAALTSLPWFREGRMPDWLRERLIEEAGAQADAIRDVLRSLIERSQRPIGDDRDPIRFRIATEDRAGLAEAHDDEIFLDFLAKGKITDLEVPWLRALKSLLPQNARALADAKALATASIGAALAGLAWMVAPVGARVGALDHNNAAAAALPDGAWLPLVLVLAAVPVVLAIADVHPLRALTAFGLPRLSLFARASVFLGFLVFLLLMLGGHGSPFALAAFVLLAPAASILVARAALQQMEEPVSISQRPAKWAIGLATKSVALVAFWATVALIYFGGEISSQTALRSIVAAILASLAIAAAASAANRWFHVR